MHEISLKPAWHVRQHMALDRSCISFSYKCECW